MLENLFNENTISILDLLFDDPVASFDKDTLQQMSCLTGYIGDIDFQDAINTLLYYGLITVNGNDVSLNLDSKIIDNLLVIDTLISKEESKKPFYNA